MPETMHQVKKYANGRLYDVAQKKYITIEDIKDFVSKGIAFKVVVSKTEEDITTDILAKIKEESAPEAGKAPEGKKRKTAKVVPHIQVEKKKKSGDLSRSDVHGDEPETILGKVFRMGEETLSGYSQKYADLWHSAMTMAEEEFEKRVKQLVKTKELSESEAGRVKNEVTGVTRNIKKWLGGNIEERIEEILAGMNLATRDQVDKLAHKIDELHKKLEILEKMEKGPQDKSPDEMSDD